MSKIYKHIFFDLDRTLWHFDENSKKVLHDIYLEYQLGDRIITVELFIETYKEINEQLWALYSSNKIDKDELRWKRFADTLNHFKINDYELAVEIGEYYINHSPRQTLLFPHTIKTLDYLTQKYQLHIITNGFEEVQYIKLTESGILKYFDKIILSEKVGVKKPHPYIFKKATSEAGALVKDSVMVGDDLYADIYGAQRVKMDHVYFNFHNTPHDKKVQHEINCLSELRNIL